MKKERKQLALALVANYRERKSVYRQTLFIYRIRNNTRKVKRS